MGEHLRIPSIKNLTFPLGEVRALVQEILTIASIGPNSFGVHGVEHNFASVLLLLLELCLFPSRLNFFRIDIQYSEINFVFSGKVPLRE